jgi:hypothetical protein
MAKLLRIFLAAVSVGMMLVFAVVLFQPLFPLPIYPVVKPISYGLLAAVILLVPNIGILIMEARAIRKQLTWMSVAAAAAVFAVVFVIQLAIVPMLFGEAVRSETSNGAHFGTYDAAVQKKMDALPLVPEIGDGAEIISYHYEYAPMLKTWSIRLEIEWKDAQQFEAELARLSAFETQQDAKWNVITAETYGAVTAAYFSNDAEKRIQYDFCDGIRAVQK